MATLLYFPTPCLLLCPRRRPLQTLYRLRSGDEAWGLGRGITGCSCKKRFTESDTKKEVVLGLPVLRLAEHCYGELSGFGVFGCDQKCYLCYDGVKSICSGKCDGTAKASFFRGGGSSTKTHLSNGDIPRQISNQKEYKAALFPICIVSNQTELQQRIDTKGMVRVPRPASSKIFHMRDHCWRR